MSISSEKVSVIIPIYNVESFLDECIQSVCQQSYSNLEIILVDDGSTDGCGEKCERWLEKDSRIRVIHKENGGLSSARNAALDIATGTYVYFCDSDDYIKEDLLQRTITYMNKGYDMVSFEYSEVYDNGTIRPHIYHKEGVFKIRDGNEKKEFLTKIVLNSRIGWSACTRIYKREIIEKYSLRFADNRHIFAEDLYFTTCYSAHVKKVLSLNSSLYYYRQRDNSIMHENVIQLNANRMNECGKEVLRHFKQYEDCKELIDIFPVIHFMILYNVISKYQRIMCLNIKELKKKVLDDVEDWRFLKKQLENLKKYRRYLRAIYSRIRTEKLINNVQFVLDGNYAKYVVRECVLDLIGHVVKIGKKK